MKKSKWIFSFLVCVVLVVGCVLVVKKDDYSYYLAMGDYVSNTQILKDKEVSSFTSLLGDYLLENKLINEVNKEYLKNNMTSKSLLEMIEKDGYKIENAPLSELIKKSKYITISLGMNDIISQLKYDSYDDKLIYDKDVISNKIEIFKHNYHQVLEDIKDINGDAKIILVGSYRVYGDDELSIYMNNAIKEVAEFGAYYIDVSDLDRYVYNENELYLSNVGHEIIYNRVVECINKID